VAFLVAAISLMSAPLLNPDGLEMAQVGKCILGLSPLELGCCDVWQPLYYPPVFPLLSGFLSWVFGVGGLFILSLMAAGMLVRPLSRLVEGLSGHKNVTAVLAVTLLSISSYSFYGMLAEPRMLFVFALFSVWSMMLKSEGQRPSRQPLFAIGVLSASLMLIRPEGILVGPLLVCYAFWRLGRRGWRVAAGLLVVALPWWGLLSAYSGRLTVSSRSWELAGVSMLSYLPVRPLVQLWGVGASERPMREALSGLGPSEFSGESGLFDSLLSVFSSLSGNLPAPLLVLAIIGIYLSLRSSDHRHVSVAMGLVVIPSFALSMTPVGRDVAMPLNNLLPVVFVLVVYGVVGMYWLSTVIRRRMQVSQRAAQLTLLSAIIVGGLFTPYPNSQLYWPQSSESGLMAASWINENTDQSETVASTFATSPIAHLSQRPWRALPSRWDGGSWSSEEAPSWFIVSAVDGTWPINSPMFRREMNIEPRAVFSDAHGWALVLERTASISIRP
jgi:hypothetical protein